jgi:hypothetical protein
MLFLTKSIILKKYIYIKLKLTISKLVEHIKL